MTSILEDNSRIDFLMKPYFNTQNGFDKTGVKKAFLDFCRTLKIKDDNRATLKQSAEDFILERLSLLTENEFFSQKSFDDFHEESCVKLIETWDELTFGQAQKWINMTLKYWLLFGDKRIGGIEKNAKYFHIPIDSYVQKEMFKEKNPDPWSKFADYQTYFNYQERHRKKATGNAPIIDEFKFFNEYIPPK